MTFDFEKEGIYVCDNGMDDGGMNIGWQGGFASMSLELEEAKAMLGMLGRAIREVNKQRKADGGQ